MPKHNQTSFKPGQSGNPNGRPKKGYSITEMFQEMFAEHPERKAELGEAIYRKARKGDPTAIKLVWNYMDGMPKQSTDITSGGKTISPTITVMSEEAKKNLEKLYEGSDSSNE